ncbi:hypothetical protein PICSAR215_03996 [Mycobacterium avium subsp. paratuberculosis]|nr:hypothetical protein PICSAR215_03996 [Mycobacterium avium subsp. paratuberculosis]
MVENGVDGVAPRLARRLHRRQPGERLVPRAGEDHRIVVHLIAAVASLPDVAPPQILEPPVLGRHAAPRRAVRVPRVAARPVVPIPHDGNQIRCRVAHRPAPALTGPGFHDQAAVERVPHGPGHELLPRRPGAAGERGNDLPPDFRGDLVGRAVAGRLAAAGLVDQVRGRGVEIADVDREHRDVAVPIENRWPLPHSGLVDRRQRPFGAGVEQVSAQQLELGVEVVLDAAQRLETIPGHPPQLVHRVGIAALPGPRRLRLQRAVGRRDGGGEAVQPGHGAARARGTHWGGEEFGARGVDGDHDVIRCHPRSVGQRDLHPGPQMRRPARVDGHRVEAGRRGADEADAERDEVAVPVVEPRLGGGTVEHAVGLVVAAVHVQVQLQIGADVGAGVTPTGVEGHQNLWHLPQQRVATRRVGVLVQPGAAIVADEEVVGRHVLQLARPAQRTGDQVAQHSALKGRDIAEGETHRRELAEDAEEFGAAARQFAREDQRRLAVDGDALGDHPPDVVVDGARGRRPAARVPELVDRDALEQVPDVQVVGREEAEAVFAGDGAPQVGGPAGPAREGTQFGVAPVVGAHGRILRRGKASQLDGRVGSGRLGSQPVAFVLLRLVHRHDEAALGEFVGGGESGDAGAEHRDGGTSCQRRRGPDVLAHAPARSSDSSAGWVEARTAACT